MKSNHSSLLHWLGGLGWVMLGAAIVIAIRLTEKTTTEDSSAVKILDEGAAQISARPIKPRISLDLADAGVLARQMEDQPGEVMNFIDALQDRELAGALALEFAKSVQGLHYDLLVEWISRQPDKRIASLVFRAMVPRLIREDPDSCIALSFGLGNSEDARLARDEFFFALPLEQRVRLVNQQSVEERAWLLSRRATGFGERAPELCLEMIEALPKSEHSQEALRKLMKAWVAGGNVYHLADPKGAVKSVMAIQHPELRMEGLRLATFEWSKNHPDLASKWIANLPAGPERDASIEGLVNQLAAADLEAATNWANSINDGKLRDRTIERLNEGTSKPAEEGN